MTTRLDRSSAGVAEAAPVRAVHLGLGGFHRAHQAWYTAADPEWGIAAYTFRNTELPRWLTEQGGLYTMLTRGEQENHVEIVPSISRAHAGTERDQWLADVATPEVAVITLTVTESAYHAAQPGQDSAVARLVEGLDRRYRANAAPIALVSCDNLPHNGAVLRRAIHDSVDRGVAGVDAGLGTWIDESVSFVDTVVDRITPATTGADRETVSTILALEDRAPVVTEPFTEWLLAGQFPGGRPEWERRGARFVDDVDAYQQRKLQFLNGAHTLLAYVGLARGYRTVSDALHDDTIAAAMESWWDTAARHSTLPGKHLAAYRERLRARFAAPGIEHRLAQIAKDGSQKIPARILPVLRAERREGRLPGSAVTVLAAWLRYLRADDVGDPHAAELV
ncbi:MAG: mannitol dehydrogenase family protein, partial [Sciscionella sp.]